MSTHLILERPILIRDVVVYSFGDLGQRLSFIYWVPNETIADLKARNFQLNLFYQWDGVTYDGYNDYYGQLGFRRRVGRNTMVG